ncbi:bZIP transcription factor [Aspergillus saccharolyticus JOP 1030-1]|uniref:BZIP domain-containing protein n=1 Tax=Aspergillus saccharolyticus JOP 1030-1 TaxID=1450539 RepID=A0A318ZEQ3_9EURO|nr:hypothetical protein BP01DRAFT_422948 [Aspergillus saccharolyticus JOP 1030-1]PYH45899.1 hypothetical protein BP01DRAFT_422948 [Aspergillus saccharolyticus JOP 1030-1]
MYNTVHRKPFKMPIEMSPPHIPSPSSSPGIWQPSDFGTLNYLSLLHELSSPSPSIEFVQSSSHATDEEYTTPSTTTKTAPRSRQTPQKPNSASTRTKSKLNTTRKRGRPRIAATKTTSPDTTTPGEGDDDAASKERRKLQIRVAQRAYRSRQQERIAHLQQQVHELEQRLLIARNIYLSTHHAAAGEASPLPAKARIFQENLRLLLAITEVQAGGRRRASTGSEEEELGVGVGMGGLTARTTPTAMSVDTRAYPIYAGDVNVKVNVLLPATPEPLSPGVSRFDDPFDVDL